MSPFTRALFTHLSIVTLAAVGCSSDSNPAGPGNGDDQGEHSITITSVTASSTAS